jgi:hypothetical protein
MSSLQNEMRETNLKGSNNQGNEGAEFETTEDNL